MLVAASALMFSVNYVVVYNCFYIIKYITEDGFIIPEKNVKGELYIGEKKKKVYDILVRSILQNAIHKEGSWNKKLCNYLEDISKMAAVDKARKTLKKKSGKVSSEVFCEQHAPSSHTSNNGGTKSLSNWPNFHRKIFNTSSAPVTCISMTNSGHHKVANLKRCFSAKENSPYIFPLMLSGAFKDQIYSLLDYEKSYKQKKRKRKQFWNTHTNFKNLQSKILPSKSISPQQSLKFSRCKITLFYHGHLHLSNFQRSLTQDIVIKQQHCGGTPVVVYKGKICASEMLSFFSLDHHGFFFSITIFLNEIRELKLSSCCVFRYQTGRRVGGPNGTFSIRRIEGGKPCLKCQYQEIENENFQSFMHYPDNSVDNSISKENSILIFSNKNETSVNESDNVSEAKENIQANENILNIYKADLQNAADEAKSVDDDIEELLDELQHSQAKNSSTEENIVCETNGSSIEDEIKEHDKSSNSDQHETGSEISDVYVDLKMHHEIPMGSSSEDEGQHQHVVTVSVHGSPEKS